MKKDVKSVRNAVKHMNPLTAYDRGVDEGLNYGISLVIWELAERGEVTQERLSDIASDLERDSREIAEHRLSFERIKNDLLKKHGIRFDLR